ncbi:MAG TPA: trypsin-like serine protease, partial [Planctomycetota bacterium]|nr:trypsin-like serine protease [Planctomycetota bacterium]
MRSSSMRVAFALACAIGVVLCAAANEVVEVQTVLVDPAVRPAAPNAGGVAPGRVAAKVPPDFADCIPLPLPERVGPKVDVPRGRLVTYDVNTRTITIEEPPVGADGVRPGAHAVCPYIGLPLGDHMPGGIGGAVRLKSSPSGEPLAPLSFTELAKVNDTETHPYSAAVKLRMRFGQYWYVASGAMIDPMNVLTAGHCVFDYDGTDAFADEMIVTPAYVSSVGPFGTANGVRMRSWTGWTTKGQFDHDLGLIELDRPVGALCGWHGYGYSDSSSFFTGNTFFCPGYPAESPYDGQFMFNWSGSFDATDYFANKWRGNEVTIYRRAYDGQSGSGAATVTGITRTVYCVLSNGNSYLTNFPRITSDKFTDIRDGWIAADTPSAPDLVPLNVNAVPATVAAGSQLTTLNCLVHNYSSATWDGSVTLEVYLSTDDTITTSDTLIHTHSAELNLTPLSSARVQFTVPPAIPFSSSGGTRWVGVIVQA